MSSDQQPDFESKLAEIEQKLHQLRTNYQELKYRRQQKADLEGELQNLPTEEQASLGLEIERQLQELQDREAVAQYQSLKLMLESDNLPAEIQKELNGELFNDWFWQIVRFGGLGVIIGWMLKSCSLGG